MSRPSARHFFQNWRTWEGSLAEKARLAARNNLIKARRRSDCCGHHGEPGC